MAYSIIFLLILLCLSAFFSGSETSLFSLSKISVRRLKVDNARNSAIVESLLGSPTDLLITILIGNMFSNVFAASIAAAISIKMWGEKGVGISIAAMTAIVVVFCEIMPKIIAIKNARRFSLFASPSIAFFSQLVFPLRFVLSRLAEAMLSFLSRSAKKTESYITKDELESAIKVGYSKEGILDREEAEMMEDVLQLSDKRVKDVMVNERDIVSFPVDMPMAAMSLAIKEAELSRIPVYEENKSSILGILYAKDLLRKLLDPSGGIDIRKLLREPYYVGREMRLNLLLREFISRKIHLALVRDNDGRLAGLVTLEDLLEEIIGDIRDKEALLGRIIRK